MSLNIGVFTLMSDVDCIPVATHIANFIADGEHSVALKEAISKEDVFETAKADFEEDGTFAVNGVRYYPNGCQSEIKEDTIVTVFGEVGFLQEFEDTFAKLYLVCHGRVENKVIIDQFLTEMPQNVQKNIELILVGASKAELSCFLTGYRCINIPAFHSNVCPYNLALRISSLFAEHGLLRPVRHKDWVYDEITYHYVPEPEKQNLFSRLGIGGKKKKQKEQESLTEQEVKQETELEPESIISEIQVHEKKVVSDANEFTDEWEIVDVPVPAPKEQKTEPIPEFTPESETALEPKPEPAPAPETEAAPIKEPVKNVPQKKASKRERPKREKTRKERPKREKQKKKKSLLSQEEEQKEQGKEPDYVTTVDVTLEPISEFVPDPEPETVSTPAELPEPMKEVVVPKLETQEPASVPIPEIETKPRTKRKKKENESDAITERTALFGRRRKKEKLHLARLNVFVSGIDHSVGTSYVAGSLASAITDIYDMDVWLDNKGMSSMPDNYMVHEVVSDADRFNALKGIIIQDKGTYEELSIIDRNEMMHADMNIMVSTAEERDLQKIAQFIDIQGDLIQNWMFVFNHVLAHQKPVLEAAMREYAYIIVPFHDNAEVPDELLKEWKDAIDYFTN